MTRFTADPDEIQVSLTYLVKVHFPEIRDDKRIRALVHELRTGFVIILDQRQPMFALEGDTQH